jgi:hypothetical protein
MVRRLADTAAAPKEISGCCAGRLRSLVGLCDQVSRETNVVDQTQLRAPDV